MAFLKVTDSKTSLEVTVFSEQYRQFKNLLHEGSFYYLNGKVQARDGRLQLVLNNLKEAVNERFWIQVPNHDHDAEIYHILDQYKGQIPVVIRYENEQKKYSFAWLFSCKRRWLTRIFKTDCHENDLSLKINENKRILTLNMV